MGSSIIDQYSMPNRLSHLHMYTGSPLWSWTPWDWFLNTLRSILYSAALASQHVRYKGRVYYICTLFPKALQFPPTQCQLTALQRNKLLRSSMCSPVSLGCISRPQNPPTNLLISLPSTIHTNLVTATLFWTQYWIPTTASYLSTKPQPSSMTQMVIDINSLWHTPTLLI